MDGWVCTAVAVSTIAFCFLVNVQISCWMLQAGVWRCGGTTEADSFSEEGNEYNGNTQFPAVLCPTLTDVRAIVQPGKEFSITEAGEWGTNA